MESPLPLPVSLASTSSPVLAGLPGGSPKPLPGMNEEEHSQKVFGICRFVQIAPKTVLMDLTVRLPPPSRVGLGTAQGAQDTKYNVYIASTGNLVNPPVTTGKPYFSLGSIAPDKDGYGDMFKEVDGELWEWIGRGCVVQAASEAAPTITQLVAKEAAPGSEQNEATIGRIFAGVVARSAGAWGNDKTVCACSGRTMWEEGREMEGKKF
ncbi:copper chaperone [Cryptococcus bacillisporus CA1873]|uniref:Unplaced genomic scaffold supercont1.10, whole genome shotgun sequence n=3 Tax=Cryptococcus gattii TaxID=552467 RepID=A0A0D0VH70_CRYGA|nr:copper chaperone [Cryptococcus bacillisporus CA1280]KIR60025.1 copper chaperone [Cryptococcus bacillisporus CA1873]|eukprot:KIR60025.1 copper chaperone [Cryptococcus gattii CA1873]